MNKYYDELPNYVNEKEYPQYMDSADMFMQSKANQKRKKELRLRLLQQIKERGFTDCGMTSKEQVEKLFKY